MPATASNVRPVGTPEHHEPTAEAPRERWALIEAGDTSAAVGPLTRVAGLPNIARLVRLASRAGLQGAVIDASDAAPIQAALQRWPAPSGFRIELSSAAAAPTEGRTYLKLDGSAVFAAGELDSAAAANRAPEPIVRLTSRADARRATSELIARTKKSIDADGVVSYFIFRPISRTITRVLLHTRITPNMVSVSAGLLGIAAAICAALGGWKLVALAGALYWIGAVVDCVDGELARLRLQGSKLGEWIDSIADDVSTYSLLAGLGVGMVRDGAPETWAWAAAIGGSVGLVFNLKLCFDLARWGMVVDTARYPWFFGSPAQGDAKRSFFGKIIYAFNFLVRRDAVATMVGIALVLGYRQPAVIGFLVGVALFAATFLVHGVVVSIRRKPDEDSFWSIGYFGVKDLFTIINLLGGVIGIVFAFRGQTAYAGYSIFLGYLLGDALDGPVARLTGTSNRFGGEFDAAADHIAQAIAPAVIVYVAFASGGHQTLGVVLLAALITTASIRQARFAVEPFDYPLTYCGLPRTVSGLITISLVNSLLFFKYSFLGYYGAAAVLLLVAALNLCPIPYMTHKGRKIQGYVKPFIAAFLLVPPLMLIFAREFMFDFLFFIMFGYAMGAWIPIQPKERREFWAEYKRWSAVVAGRK